MATYTLVNAAGNAYRICSDTRQRDRYLAEGYRLAEQPQKEEKKPGKKEKAAGETP